MLSTFQFDSEDHVFYTDDAKLIWVKASPIATKLGFKRPEVAIVNNVDPDFRAKISTGVGAASWFINEPGFYQITFASQHPDAKRFQRWVFEEVLPVIRRDGGYISPEATTEQLEALQTQIDSQQGMILEMGRALAESRTQERKYELTVKDWETRIKNDIDGDPLIYHRFLKEERKKHIEETNLFNKVKETIKRMSPSQGKELLLGLLPELREVKTQTEVKVQPAKKKKIKGKYNESNSYQTK